MNYTSKAWKGLFCSSHLWPLPDDIVPGRCPEMERRVYRELRRLVGLQTDIANERAVGYLEKNRRYCTFSRYIKIFIIPLTASQVYQECPGEVLVVDEGRVHPGARLVVDAKVVHLRVPGQESRKNNHRFPQNANPPHMHQKACPSLTFQRGSTFSRRS